jgi:hypothetical protein
MRLAQVRSGHAPRHETSDHNALTLKPNPRSSRNLPKNVQIAATIGYFELKVPSSEDCLKDNPECCREL